MSLRGSWASFPLHGKGRQSKQLDTEPWAQDEHPGGEKAGRQVAENVCIELPDASAFLGIVTEQSLTRKVDGHGKHEKADGQQHSGEGGGEVVAGTSVITETEGAAP